ncbi:hypothetical protein Ppha_1451 [Pelodictyon phaeoclathratiforme BU-1]|jgi:hypothetical protein|uniref:Uncharacterized protein n=1 Tax=Pelodictyon phaeoclathratiforme (strain DSM 5477 / BU-1) TaxID=324925 RepID=B4SA09_PELPB|nr:hypothetical protein Ppha_1451 [Pelodictyon phaeoclathratiforme BU-1]
MWLFFDFIALKGADVFGKLADTRAKMVFFLRIRQIGLYNVNYLYSLYRIEVPT